MSRHFAYITVAAAMMAAVSCAKYDQNFSEQTSDAPISFDAVVADVPSTRSIVSSTELPSTFTIWASMSVTSSTTGKTDDYMVGRAFNKNGGKWKPSQKAYWPLGSKLDVLSIAGEKSALTDFPSRITWNSGSCTAGLTVDIHDGECLSSDILYASSFNLKTPQSKTESVSLNFHHTQAWLRFNLTSSLSGLVYLSSVRILDAYSGGRLMISRTDPVTPGNFICEWDFRGKSLADITVPGVSTKLLGSTPVVLDILLPSQAQKDIEFTFAYKDSPSDPAPTHTKTFVRKALPRNWYDGERYIYNVSVSTLSAFMSAPVVIPLGE